MSFHDLNSDVDLQSEDEIGACELLHVLDDLLISLALSTSFDSRQCKTGCVPPESICSPLRPAVPESAAHSITGTRIATDWEFQCRAQRPIGASRRDLLFKRDFSASKFLDVRPSARVFPDR